MMNLISKPVIYFSVFNNRTIGLAPKRFVTNQLSSLAPEPSLDYWVFSYLNDIVAFNTN